MVIRDVYVVRVGFLGVICRKSEDIGPDLAESNDRHGGSRIAEHDRARTTEARPDERQRFAARRQAVIGGRANENGRVGPDHLIRPGLDQGRFVGGAYAEFEGPIEDRGPGQVRAANGQGWTGHGHLAGGNPGSGIAEVGGGLDLVSETRASVEEQLPLSFFRKSSFQQTAIPHHHDPADSGRLVGE